LRVINGGIKWKGVTRKVNFWDRDMEEAEKKIGFEKVPTRPKGKGKASSSPPKSDTPKTKTGTPKTTAPAAPAGRTARYD